MDSYNVQSHTLDVWESALFPSGPSPLSGEVLFGSQSTTNNAVNRDVNVSHVTTTSEVNQSTTTDNIRKKSTVNECNDDNHVSAVLSLDDINQIAPTLTASDKVKSLKSALKKAKKEERAELKALGQKTKRKSKGHTAAKKKGKKDEQTESKRPKDNSQKPYCDTVDMNASVHKDLVSLIAKKADALKTSGQSVTRTMCRSGGLSKHWWCVIPNWTNQFGVANKHRLYFARKGKSGKSFKMTWFKEQKGTEVNSKESGKDSESDSHSDSKTDNEPQPSAEKQPEDPPASKKHKKNPEREQSLDPK